MIIGITGFINSGKDTVADYLVAYHGFKRDSFAGTLKDAVSAVFGWDREMLEGRSPEARHWREQADTWWSNRLSMPITPRQVLQYWGTEVCRNNYHDDIWIASLENRLAHRTGHTVISDVRFPNEIKAIKQQGGHIIWVRRGPMPSWYIMAQNANRGDIVAQTKLTQLGVHASETAWIGTEFDTVIDNNGTIDELYATVKNLVLDPLDPKEDPPA
jgi:hypothetical protein